MEDKMWHGKGLNRNMYKGRENFEYLGLEWRVIILKWTLKE